MERNLDFTINGKKLTYDKMTELYWFDLFSNHELNNPNEEYIEFFQENTKYFIQIMDVYDDCECGVTEKECFSIECYETEDSVLIAKEDKEKIKKTLRDGEHFTVTCDFTIILCPSCGRWFGYYMEFGGFFYDEEFGEVWREWVEN